MCTSFTINKKKTLVGWNLDILDMEYRVRPTDEGVYIEINDMTEVIQRKMDFCQSCFALSC